MQFTSLASLPVRRLRYYFIIFFVFYWMASWSQTGSNLPVVIQPSPQSQAFTRYGDYPMASYTGLTDITIPIHNVSSRKLSLPITISFHASGRMATEINGLLGMRWTLNCGGVVTRTMRGLPDEWNRLTAYSVDHNVVPDFDVLYSSCAQGKIDQLTLNSTMYDTELDMFSYSLPNGKTGHFILKNQNGVKVPMLIPQESLKIEIVKAPTSDGYIDNVLITDLDGTRYVFGKSGSSNSAIERRIENPIPYMNNPVPTAWYLVKIISSDAMDEIILNYSTRNEWASTSSQTAKVNDRIRSATTALSGNAEDPYATNLGEYLYWDYLEQDNAVAQFNSYVTPTLSSIQFQGGTVVLNYHDVSTHYNKMMLNEITVKQDTSTFRRVKFSASKHPFEKDIYYLNNVMYYAENSNEIQEKYQFGYYEPVNDGQIHPSTTSAVCKDWWGYYSTTTYNLLPYKSITVLRVTNFGDDPINREIGFTDIRDGDTEGKKLGMLKTITYPSGGQTEFVYESNHFVNYPHNDPPPNTATFDGPGLRIKEVISKPIGGQNIHKIYKYGVQENGSGFINKHFNPHLPWYFNIEIESNNFHYWSWFLTDIYNNVTAYNEERAGYRTREFLSDPYINFEISGNQVQYDAVSEYLTKDDLLQEKMQSFFKWGYIPDTVRFFIQDNEFAPQNVRVFSNPQNAWQTPLMTSKHFYKYVNNQFDLVKRESFEYESEESAETWDMPTCLYTNVTFAAIGFPTYTNYEKADKKYLISKGYHNNFCSVYGYSYRRYNTGAQLLKRITTEENTPAGILKTEKYIEYDPTYNLVRSEELINSKEERVKTTYAYPHDFPSDPVYQRMVQRHILSPVILSKDSAGNVQKKSTTTRYDSVFTNVFVPQHVKIRYAAGTENIIATFNKYSNMGNILEQQKVNDLKEVYLWGYDGKYPVARIVGNKSYGEIISASGIDTAQLRFPANDELLRNYLAALRNVAGVVATVYTYRPMVGITSQTDAAGRTVYYEYDAAGRLIIIRNSSKEITKKYCYNYAGQVINCSDNSVTPVFFNSQISVILTRDNCYANAADGQVTYTVPAGKHSSTISQADADAKAQADVTNNAQNYANQYGSCRTIYARIEYENVNIYNSYDSYDTYADVYVRVYSDAACTIPFVGESILWIPFEQVSGVRKATEYASCSEYENIDGESSVNIYPYIPAQAEALIASNHFIGTTIVDIYGSEQPTCETYYDFKLKN